MFRLGYNKYMKELGLTKKDYPMDRCRANKYNRKTGFNDYVTFNLNYSLVLFTYCYIRHMQDISTIVDWDYHKKDFSFDKCLEGLKVYLTKDEYEMTEEDFNLFKKSWKYIGDHIGYIWW